MVTHFHINESDDSHWFLCVLSIIFNSLDRAIPEINGTPPVEAGNPKTSGTYVIHWEIRIFYKLILNSSIWDVPLISGIDAIINTLYITIQVTSSLVVTLHLRSLCSTDHAGVDPR